ncbi:hypothetical protein [Roseivivax sp. THAF30]|uniref:hypothetical protein n=1 Tax=Roseivivax sp. THAF30 TaxID=2587852 RepID=UPI0012684EAB|nr:hypothetical protein [Roseivivax sp. THAF30]QFT63215.1 hypothetical protein FIU91_09790 [Roseivivax sp. THAF30]
MNDIAELERRIASALDRIARGVEGLGAAGDGEVSAAPEAAASEELTALQAALEDERIANAQLEERVRAIREKQDSEVAKLRAEAEEARAALAGLDSDLQRLRHANDMLTATNEEMRRALEENVGEPHLINKAMLAELESLRAARAADAAESRAVLGALTPLLAEAEARATTEQEAT